REPAQIIVIDCERAAIERTLTVPSEGPHGLWLDRGRLFCAADGGQLVVLDRDSGDVRRSLPLPGVPDVVMHDPDLRRLYVAIGGGVIAALLAGTAAVSVLIARGGDRIGRRRCYRLLFVAMGAAGAVFALTGWLPALILAALSGTVSTDVVESGPFTSLEQAM